MKSFNEDSKIRLKDFKRRKDYSPDSVYIHSSLGHEYIPIHPFSDERGILTKLNILASDCVSVDAWWNMESDMSLLGVITQKFIKNRKAGIYVSWSQAEPGYLYFLAVTESDVVSRVLFESVMNKINKHNLNLSENLRRQLSSKLVPIQDIV